MRVILLLWFIPIILFWGWYALSLNDMHFGYFFLTRHFHDHLFTIYGNILHMPAEDVPIALAWLFTIDTLIVLGIAALRWYKKWLPQTIAAVKSYWHGFFAKEETPKRTKTDFQEETSFEEFLGGNSISDPIGPARPAE